MKRIIQYKLFLLIVIAVSFIVACDPDEDENNSDDPRDKVVNTWQCDEQSQIFDKSLKSIYTVDISKDENSEDMVYIDNFYQLGASKYVMAKLNGTNLTITNQLIDNHTVNGSGLILNNFKEISWTYYVDDGSGVDIDTVTATYVPAF